MPSASYRRSYPLGVHPRSPDITVPRSRTSSPRPRCGWCCHLPNTESGGARRLVRTTDLLLSAFKRLLRLASYNSQPYWRRCQGNNFDSRIPVSHEVLESDAPLVAPFLHVYKRLRRRVHLEEKPALRLPFHALCLPLACGLPRMLQRRV
jgi:hypothetical protein